MKWFQHSNTASNSTDLRRLEQALGLAGLGCYWKLVEKVHLNDGSFPLEEAMSWARRDFSSRKIRAVINDYGLFTVDEMNLIHIADTTHAKESEMMTEQTAETVTAIEEEENISSKNDAKNDAKNDEIKINSSKNAANFDEINQPNVRASSCTIQEKRIEEKREEKSVTSFFARGESLEEEEGSWPAAAEYSTRGPTKPGQNVPRRDGRVLSTRKLCRAATRTAFLRANCAAPRRGWTFCAEIVPRRDEDGLSTRKLCRNATRTDFLRKNCAAPRRGWTFCEKIGQKNRGTSTLTGKC